MGRLIVSLKGALLGSALVCCASAAAADCTFEPRVPTSRYEISGSQVFDKETKLTWQRCSMGQKWTEGTGCTGTPQQVSWAEAQKLGGAWRLPTKDELLSLVSKACLRSVNAEVFPGFTRQFPSYWSSTETAPDLTWIVDLTTGGEFNALRTASNGVVLVQGPGSAVAAQ
jgi:hypothetical protein